MQIEVHNQDCACDFCEASMRELKGAQGIREEYVEKVIAWVLKESMADAKGNQTLGVGLALKRVFIAGFKTGKSLPNATH